MKTIPCSPFRKDVPALLSQSYSVKTICERWEEGYNIDVKKYFNSVSELDEYRCPLTGLRFFFPESFAGDHGFYNELSRFPWYYMDNKWEHRTAMDFIESGDRLLEVGCGSGSFVNRVTTSNGVDALGIELNTSEVEIAKAKGWNVINDDLAKVAHSMPAAFDKVCHFEVLEHVANPKEFISLCLECLKPNGQLIIAVPNNDSFIRNAELNLLNLPPHHMGLWTLDVFKKMEDYFPIKLESWRFEPLAEYHYDWFLNIQEGKMLGYKRRLFGKSRKALKLLLKLGFNKLIRGHTLLVIFRYTP